MEQNKIGSTWLVEETDYMTGSVKFSRTYTDYTEAMAAYSDLKRVNRMNTISIEKCERSLLQE
jgi:hypothetical protein